MKYFPFNRKTIINGSVNGHAKINGKKHNGVAHNGSEHNGCANNNHAHNGNVHNGVEHNGNVHEESSQDNMVISAISAARARDVLGERFVGTFEAVKYFNAEFQDLNPFAWVPFSEEKLEKTRNTHILVALPRISIIDMQLRLASRRLFNRDEPFSEYSCAHECGEPAYHLINLFPVDNSFSTDWCSLQNLVNTCGDAIPTTQSMVYALVSYLLIFGELPFDRIAVRTSSTRSAESTAYHMEVSASKHGKIHIVENWDKVNTYWLGGASEIKPSLP